MDKATEPTTRSFKKSDNVLSLFSELVKDMKKMSQNASTSAVEIFHALKIRYLPKSTFFEKKKMVASTKVAIS